MTRKIRIFALMLCALVMFGGAGAAQASVPYDDCGRRIANEERVLDRAIHNHGYNSRQAENARRELARLRWECGRR
jgi:hypothetical protein